VTDFAKYPNPYDFANPVGEKSMFVGREGIMRDVRYYLDHAITAPRPINLAILGDRASGKTSILNMIELEASERNFCAVRVDLDEGDAHSPLVFFYKLFDAILTKACQEGAFEGTVGKTYECYRDMVDAYEIPTEKLFCPFLFPMQYARAMRSGHRDIALSDSAFKTDIGTIQRELNRTVLVIMDECDVLAQSRVHLEKLRNIFMNIQGYMLVVTGTQNFFPVMDEVFSPIIRQFKRIEVGPYDDEKDTKNLIRKPLEKIGISDPSLVFDFETYRDVTEIHELSGGKPYEIQLLCHFLFRRLQEHRTNRMRLNVDLLDDVLKELESSQDVSRRPVINAIRNLSEDEIKALNVLTQCNRHADFESLWCAEYTFYGEDRWTKERLHEHLKSLESRGVLGLEDDRIVFLGDEFEKIYCKYWARNRKFALRILDSPFEVFFLSRLNRHISRSESLVPELRLATYYGSDLGSFQEICDALASAQPSIDIYESAPSYALLAYWLLIENKKEQVIETTEVSVEAPWVNLRQWYRARDPNSAGRIIDYQSALSEPAMRIAHLGGTIKFENHLLPMVSTERLAAQVVASVNSQIRDIIASTHVLQMVSAYSEKKDFEESIFHGELAYRYTQDREAANNLGYLFLVMDDLDSASDWLSKALVEDLGKVLGISQYNLGILSAKRGDLDSAAARFQEAIDNPGHAHDPNQTSTCLIVPVLSKSGNYLDFEEQFSINLLETAKTALSTIKGIMDSE